MHFKELTLAAGVAVLLPPQSAAEAPSSDAPRPPGGCLPGSHGIPRPSTCADDDLCRCLREDFLGGSCPQLVDRACGDGTIDDCAAGPSVRTACRTARCFVGAGDDAVERAACACVQMAGSCDEISGYCDRGVAPAAACPPAAICGVRDCCAAAASAGDKLRCLAAPDEEAPGGGGEGHEVQGEGASGEAASAGDASGNVTASDAVAEDVAGEGTTGDVSSAGDTSGNVTASHAGAEVAVGGGTSADPAPTDSEAAGGAAAGDAPAEREAAGAGAVGDAPAEGETAGVDAEGDTEKGEGSADGAPAAGGTAAVDAAVGDTASATCLVLEPTLVLAIAVILDCVF